MKWPELVHSDTGAIHPLNTLTPDQLRYYIQIQTEWAPGFGDQPGADLGVRKIIAAKLLVWLT